MAPGDNFRVVALCAMGGKKRKSRRNGGEPNVDEVAPQSSRKQKADPKGQESSPKRRRDGLDPDSLTEVFLGYPQVHEVLRHSSLKEGADAKGQESNLLIVRNMIPRRIAHQWLDAELWKPLVTSRLAACRRSDINTILRLSVSDYCMCGSARFAMSCRASAGCCCDASADQHASP